MYYLCMHTYSRQYVLLYITSVSCVYILQCTSSYQLLCILASTTSVVYLTYYEVVICIRDYQTTTRSSTDIYLGTPASTYYYSSQYQWSQILKYYCQSTRVVWIHYDLCIQLVVAIRKTTQYYAYYQLLEQYAQ